MIDILRDLAECSLYLVLIALAISVIVFVALGVYVIIKDVQRYANK